MNLDFNFNKSITIILKNKLLDFFVQALGIDAKILLPALCKRL